jgi:hypothetical protein
VRVVAGFFGLVLAALLGLYGAFLILYQGEEGSQGDTYFNLGGTKVDADFIGIPLVVLSLVMIVLSFRALRRSRVP